MYWGQLYFTFRRWTENAGTGQSCGKTKLEEIPNVHSQTLIFAGVRFLGPPRIAQKMQVVNATTVVQVLDIYSLLSTPVYVF
jgi:hypothetical protein